MKFKKLMSLCCVMGISMNINPNVIAEEQPRQRIKTDFLESNMTDILSNTDKIRKFAEEKRIQEEIKKQQENERIRNVCFNSYDLTQISGITKEEMRIVLNSKEKYLGLAEFADTFVEAEQKYGVNVFALIAIPALESGWNTSRRANDGHNNIIGMAVEEDSDVGTKYSSKHDCIMDLARQLKTFYLTPGGNCYNGTSTSKVNKMYCATPDWYKRIDKIGDELAQSYHEIYGYGEK